MPGKVLNQLKEPVADLSGDSSWNAYLDEIEAYKPGSNLQQANLMVPEKLGTFVNVWQYQSHILTTAVSFRHAECRNLMTIADPRQSSTLIPYVLHYI